MDKGNLLVRIDIDMKENFLIIIFKEKVLMNGLMGKNILETGNMVGSKVLEFLSDKMEEFIQETFPLIKKKDEESWNDLMGKNMKVSGIKGGCMDKD